MCSSKLHPPPIARINGRLVLQPPCNRVPSLEHRHSLNNISPKPPTTLPAAPLPSPATTTTNTNTKIKPSLTPPISPNSKSPRPPVLKTGNDPSGLNSSVEKVLTPQCTTKPPGSVNKSKQSSGDVAPSIDTASFNYSSSIIVEAPGSIAAARREQVAIMQVLGAEIPRTP